ncbi:MAG: hypothetical protein LBG43_05765 [Treponema sp.]|jgi:hypothetical protein|nr:hypothetical protein [Treponema sp.]
MAEIHESAAQTNGGSIVEKMAHMMGDAAQTAGEGADWVCGACFFSKTMPDTTALSPDKNGMRLLRIITRAKKNAAGFTPPSHKNAPSKRGEDEDEREKNITWNFRTRRKELADAVMKIHNKDQRVGFLCLDALWKPVKRTVRFVLTEMNGRRFIPTSSDASAQPPNKSPVFTAAVLRSRVCQAI